MYIYRWHTFTVAFERKKTAFRCGRGSFERCDIAVATFGAMSQLREGISSKVIFGLPIASFTAVANWDSSPLT